MGRSHMLSLSSPLLFFSFFSLSLFLYLTTTPPILTISITSLVSLFHHGS